MLVVVREKDNSLTKPMIWSSLPSVGFAYPIILILCIICVPSVS